MEGVDFTGAITKKIGPLPGYAYIIIGVGGVFLYRKFRPSSKNVVGPVTPETSGAAPTTASVNDVPVQSNDQWALHAADHLLTTTILHPGEISTALSNYLSGAGLTSKQQSIIDQAIVAQGYPTQGLIPIVSADVPLPDILAPTPTYQNMPIPAVSTPAYQPPPDPFYVANPYPSYSPAPTPTYHSVPASPPTTIIIPGSHPPINLSAIGRVSPLTPRSARGD